MIWIKIWFQWLEKGLDASCLVVKPQTCTKSNMTSFLQSFVQNRLFLRNRKNGENCYFLIRSFWCRPYVIFVCCCCAWCICGYQKKLLHIILCKQHWIFTPRDTSWTSQQWYHCNSWKWKFEIAGGKICDFKIPCRKLFLHNGMFHLNKKIRLLVDLDSK